MTPILRNAAIAAGATLLPAAIAAAVYTQQHRPRTFPERIGDRIRGLWEEESGPEAALRRIGQRLDYLGDRVDHLGRSTALSAGNAGRDLARRAHETSPETRTAAGVALLLAIPAVLAAVFPAQRRAAIEGVRDYFDHDETDEQIEKELEGLNERLSALTGDIERHRQSNFDAVTAAAEKRRKD